MAITYWTAGASGSASDDGNWDNGIPNASNHAYFRSASSNHKCKWDITTAVEGIYQDNDYTGEIYLVNNLYISSSALADKVLCRNASSVFTSNNYKIVNNGGNYLYFLGGTANMGTSDVSSSAAISLGATLNIGASTWTCGDDFRAGSSVVNITGNTIISGAGAGSIGGTGWTVAGTNAPIIKFGRIYGSQGFSFAEVGNSTLVINAKSNDDTTIGKADASKGYFYNFILDNPSSYKRTCYQKGDIVCSGNFIVSGGTYRTDDGFDNVYDLNVSGITSIGPMTGVDNSADATFQTTSSTCNFRPQMDGGKPADSLAGIYQYAYGTTDLGTGVINCNGWKIVGPGYGTTTPFSKTSGEINVYGYWDSNEYCTSQNSAHLDFGTTSILISGSESGVLWNIHDIGGAVHTWTCSGLTFKLESADDTVRMYNRRGDPTDGVATRTFEVSGNLIIEKGKLNTRIDGVSNDVCGLKATHLWIKEDGTLDANKGTDSGVVTRNGCDHTFGTMTIGPESPSTTPGGLYNATSGNTIITAEDGSLRGGRAIYWRYGNFNHNYGSLLFTNTDADMEQGVGPLWNVSGTRINLKYNPDNIDNNFTIEETHLNGWPWTTNIGGDLIITDAGGGAGFSAGGQEHNLTISGSVIMQPGSKWGKTDYGASGQRHIYGGFFNNGGTIY